MGKSEMRLSVGLTRVKRTSGPKIVSRFSFSFLLMNEPVTQELLKMAELNGTTSLMIFMSEYSWSCEAFCMKMYIL